MCLVCGSGRLSGNRRHDASVARGEALDQVERPPLDWDAMPFLTGAVGARLGLAPVPIARWLPNTISEPERVRKLSLLQDPRRGAYLRVRACHRNAVETAEQVAAAMAEQTGVVLFEDARFEEARLEEASSPLVALALSVPEDVCLMQRDTPGGDYRLVSACVCSPSYWSLPEKLGATLMELHQAVPDRTQTLADRMHAVFAALPKERVFERRNWSIHGSGALWQPQPAPDPEPDGPLWLRSERQCLRRIDRDSVLFTIGVELAPLAHIAAHDRARSALQSVLQSLRGKTLKAFGGAAKRDRTFEFLDSETA